jgi:hypothetical protein
MPARSATARKPYAASIFLHPRVARDRRDDERITARDRAAEGSRGL